YGKSFTYYENKVRVRVEKYFFDTLPTGQTVDVSTFIEGGDQKHDAKPTGTNAPKYAYRGCTTANEPWWS
ncbi:hypothetical protein, partial [Heyndrickxia ginsengihumi]|uniref:hypothetical protein n=1 Tax=Heyndrickxia ginsengihumi TaxID=363870 RepID=UPI003D2249C0